MRVYVSVTPAELQSLLHDGFVNATDAYVAEIDEETDLGDETELEELEFAASWEAAAESREKQGPSASVGFALAVEIADEQVADSGRIQLQSKVTFPQVQALLVSDSEEPELSWFAPQEIATYLPGWLA